MAEMDQNKTTSFDLEEQYEKHLQTRRKRIKLIVIVVLMLAFLMGGFQIFMAVRSYQSYEVTKAIDRRGSSMENFIEFGGNIVMYNNDGILYCDAENQKLWNQTFEMSTPKISVAGDYLVVYDQDGLQAYIMSVDGLEKRIETVKPIKTACIAEQGTIAVLMQENNVFYVKLYDRTGEELANGKFYGEQGGYPIDIALSADAKKMAVDFVDISEGKVNSAITFYNFGSVGQNEIDNNVGVFSFEDLLIPEIEYLTGDKMIAIADQKLIFFDGSQKPNIVEEIEFETTIQSVFYDKKHVGVVYYEEDESEKKHIRVYNMKGSVVMENDTSIRFSKVAFLSNDEVCFYGENSCELFSIHGIKKFSYEFEEQLRFMKPKDKFQNYIFVFDSTMEEVHLK